MITFDAVLATLRSKLNIYSFIAMLVTSRVFQSVGSTAVAHCDTFASQECHNIRTPLYQTSL